MIRRSSFFRVDENVFFTMSGVLLFSLVVFAFRFGMHKDCMPITITAGEKKLPSITNKLISFKTDIKDASLLVWDFGDGTPPEKTSISATTHLFKNSGIYTVTVTANGTCTGTLDLSVREAPVQPEPTSKGLLLGPEGVTINQTYTYSDTSSKHGHWEWHVSDRAEPIGNTKDVQITFDKEGPVTVWVKPDFKDEDIIKKYVIVIQDPVKVEEAKQALIRSQRKAEPVVNVDKIKSTEPPLTAPANTTRDEAKKSEPPPAPPKTKKPAIEPKAFGAMIQNYNEGKTTREDFNQYFCGDVTVIYEKETMTFDKFMEKVLRIGKGKIKSVGIDELTRDDFNCIFKIKVTIREKKGLLGIFH